MFRHESLQIDAALQLVILHQNATVHDQRVHRCWGAERQGGQRISGTGVVQLIEVKEGNIGGLAGFQRSNILTAQAAGASFGGHPEDVFDLQGRGSVN